MKTMSHKKKGLRFAIFFSVIFFIFAFGPICRSEDAYLEAYSPNGTLVGKVGYNGVVFNRLGKNIGKVEVNGSVFNRLGTKIGEVSDDGRICNVSGKKIGEIDSEGEVFNELRKKIGQVQVDQDLILSGGGALIFFLQPK